MSEKVPKAAAAFKPWAVLSFSNGAVTVVPNKAGSAWDKVSYPCVTGYFETKKEAVAAATKMQAEANRLEAMYGDPIPGKSAPVSPEMQKFLDGLITGEK